MNWRITNSRTASHRNFQRRFIPKDFLFRFSCKLHAVWKKYPMWRQRSVGLAQCCCGNCVLRVLFLLFFRLTGQVQISRVDLAVLIEIVWSVCRSKYFGPLRSSCKTMHACSTSLHIVILLIVFPNPPLLKIGIVTPWKSSSLRGVCTKFTSVQGERLSRSYI